MNMPAERKRLVLTIAPVDWAAEWLRPISPNFKMVGPILSEPGKPLPAELEVSCLPALNHQQHKLYVVMVRMRGSKLMYSMTLA